MRFQCSVLAAGRPFIGVGIFLLLSAGIFGLGCSRTSYRRSSETVVPVVQTTRIPERHAVPGSAHISMSTGSVSGTVRNSRGGVIRNARISVSGEGLVEPRSTVTDNAGNYIISAIPSGWDCLFTVHADRFVFGQPSRRVAVDGDITHIDFVGDPYR